MPWPEFRQLLAGISSDTPLGRIIAIRSETDRKVINEFTPAQREIRNKWLRRKVRTISAEDRDKMLEQLLSALKSAAGAGNG